MAHVCDLHNHRAHNNNDDFLPPLQLALGEVGDISLLTEYLFNDPIMYQDITSRFPEAGGNEKLGRWYG